jgi:Arc/MetJ-type ribon-helix-helix transcriptional regulator
MRRDGMIRTQVQLTEQQHLRLRALAAERGLSISQLVRDGVDNVLAQIEEGAQGHRAQRAIAAAGRFHSGRRDVARRHDDYLVTAYETSEEAGALR